MRRQRNTKIIATLGPATTTRQEIRALFEAGADVFCMDMRYGAHADHLVRYGMIRDVEKEVARPIGVLMNLQGPKLRIGSFRQAGVELIPGQKFSLDLSTRLGDHNRAGFPHPEVYSGLASGDLLFLDDGRIRLRVESIDEDTIATTVETGGVTRNGGEIKAPNVHLPIESLPAKDAEDLAFGLSIGIDWVALAFVQNGQDIVALRERIGAGNCPRIIAKLEKSSSLEHLDSIVDAADAVMICRGELGVELEIEEVPIAQRRIVRACRARGRPVVIATQMLDSMVRDAAPTPAEANDVAAAIYDGADAMMLTAETAAGRYPAETARMMDRIARRVERDPDYERKLSSRSSESECANCTDAISAAIRTTADLLPISFAAAYTSSGATCLAIAGVRLRSPILGLSPSLSTVRMLSLVWGVHSVHMEGVTSVEDMLDSAIRAARRYDFAEKGQPFAMVAGMPFGVQGATNLLRIGWG